MKRGTDYIGVGVGAVIVDDQGRLFLARRGPQAKNERGLWEFPGGSVEFGETLVEALQREMREEYGIEIAVGELLDVADHILPDEGQHWVSPAFICTIAESEPVIREKAKCSEIGWFAPGEIPEDLTQVTRFNLEHYRQRVGAGQAGESLVEVAIPAALFGAAFTRGDDTLIPLDGIHFQRLLDEKRLDWEVSDGLKEYGLALAFKEEAKDFCEGEAAESLDRLVDNSCLVVPHPDREAAIVLVEPAPLRRLLRRYLPIAQNAVYTVSPRQFSRRVSPLGHATRQEASDAVQQSGNFYGFAGVCSSCGEPGCGSSYAWIEDRLCVLTVETVGCGARVVKLFSCKIGV